MKTLPLPRKHTESPKCRLIADTHLMKSLSYSPPDWNFIGDLLVCTTQQIFLKVYTAKLFIPKSSLIYADEARHGKAFEGLLQRYFG